MQPSWPAPALPPRVEAARHLPLVGRRVELSALEAAWSEVERRRRQVVFIGGEPGAGKTRLVAEVAGALRDNDAAVLIGGTSSEAGVPYQPFAEMLDHLFLTSPVGSLAELVADSSSELRRLSGHLVAHRPDLGDAAPAPGEFRRDLFDSVAGLFRRMADDRPVALIVDDLHWAQLPTLALLEHVVHACPDSRLLVLAAFRSTSPDRSDDVVARVAELHRLDGVQRLDLSGLDADAIAEYVSARSGLPPAAVREPASVLRDRTGGNPFFLRELWTDLERHGGVAALRSRLGVPASIGDTLAGRLAVLTEPARRVVDVAAVLGDALDLATLVAASEEDRLTTLAALDEAIAVGLVETVDPLGGAYTFVHALARQAVLERLPPSRATLLHARVAVALEQQPAHASLVPSLARHYLAAHVLGFEAQAVRSCREAGELAERSLAFEDAAGWFERGAELPCGRAMRRDLLLAAATNYVRACHFPHARQIYEVLTTEGDAATRLLAAIGFEDASWRPGIIGARAAEMLGYALDGYGSDESDTRYVKALGSLGRALALAGDAAQARRVGVRAIELARRLGDDRSLMHALATSLWHGTTPGGADVQLDRATEAYELAQARHDHETVGAAVNFRATASYLLGRPRDVRDAVREAQRIAEATGQPFYRHVHHCLAHAAAYLRGDFESAERWADETVHNNDTFDPEMTEGPHSVQMFMVRRETGALEMFRPFIDGREAFAGRWVPGLLALYTELDVRDGISRALHHLLDRDLRAHTDEAQWPMELVFMTEGALALGDADAARTLRPRLAEYAGKNVVCGTLIATFGSADRYLGRVARLLGDNSGAARHFDAALEMDRRMGSVVHAAETLAQLALFTAARGDTARATSLAREARGLAEPVGDHRVLRVLDALDEPPGPDGLSEREVEVLRLLTDGLSNQEIGGRLHISANTAANHVRSILMKTGAANRTQAAVYAAQRNLV